MLDAQALVLLGSTEPHYTASKVFPYVLAQRSLLAIFHEDSSIITILNEVNAGRIVSFGEQKSPAEQADAISHHLEEMLYESYAAQVRWEAFEPYTTRALAGRLAQTFNAAIGN